jgi:hypothetical protein
VLESIALEITLPHISYPQLLLVRKIVTISTAYPNRLSQKTNA